MSSAASGKADASIIIPFRNSEPWFAAALVSARHELETYGGHAEVILVDSLSEDSSARIARQFANELGSAAVIVNSEKGGAAAARNLGARKARGEWLAFLDADDLFFDGKLTGQMKLPRGCPP